LAVCWDIPLVYITTAEFGCMLGYPSGLYNYS
jgi:hypothetical protein